MNKNSHPLIFLLFLMAMPFISSIYSLIEKMVIEHRMEERFECENLQVITIDADSVIWLKKNKELLVNGEPFDIKKLSSNGRKITVEGLFDSDEKELNQKIVKFNNAGDPSLRKTSLLVLLMFNTYFEEKHTINLTPPFVIKNKQAWQYQKENSCISYGDILTPPPRFT